MNHVIKLFGMTIAGLNGDQFLVAGGAAVVYGRVRVLDVRRESVSVNCRRTECRGEEAGREKKVCAKGSESHGEMCNVSYPRLSG